MAENSIAIPPNTVDVWLFNLDQLIYNEDVLWPILEAREQAQAAKFRFPVLRQRYIHTHGVLRQILADYLPSIYPENIRIVPAEFGKPYLSDYPELFFNLSHSGSWVLIGVASSDVGVDIEVISARSGLPGLVEKCFAPTEREYWQQLPLNQQTAVFFDFWTRKEAFVKAAGRGIALGLERCVIDTDCFADFAAIPIECGQVDDWQMIPLEAAENCKAALVIMGRDFFVRKRII